MKTLFFKCSLYDQIVKFFIRLKIIFSWFLDLKRVVLLFCFKQGHVTFEHSETSSDI